MIDKPPGWQAFEFDGDRTAALWTIGLVKKPERAIAIIGRAADDKPLFVLMLDPNNARKLNRALTGLVQGDD